MEPSSISEIEAAARKRSCEAALKDQAEIYREAGYSVALEIETKGGKIRIPFRSETEAFEWLGSSEFFSAVLVPL